MPTAHDGTGPDNVYARCLEFLEQGSIPAITRVEDTDRIGVFAVAHSFKDAPYLKRNCYHHSPRRRALAAFAMVQFARKIAVEDEFHPIP